MSASTRKVSGGRSNGRQHNEVTATSERRVNGLKHGPATPARHSSNIDKQAVAEAAYFLWLNRGGSEVENWLQAEAELKSSRGRH